MLPFVLASAVGRSGRFFLLAGVMRWGGERTERRRLCDYGVIVAAAVAAFFALR